MLWGCSDIATFSIPNGLLTWHVIVQAWWRSQICPSTSTAASRIPQVIGERASVVWPTVNEAGPYYFRCISALSLRFGMGVFLNATTLSQVFEYRASEWRQVVHLVKARGALAPLSPSARLKQSGGGGCWTAHHDSPTSELSSLAFSEAQSNCHSSNEAMVPQRLLKHMNHCYIDNLG